MKEAVVKQAYTRLWTGPAHVEQWAEKLTTAGYPPEVVGTEHLYLWLEMDPEGWGIIPALQVMEQKLDMASSGMYFPAFVLQTREV